jgi:tetratricopeptide (TPR) repeat protein
VMYPSNAEILVALSGFASNERNWPEAMGYTKRALAVDPRNPDVIWSYYNALLTFHQWEEALAATRLLEELQPNRFEVAAARSRVPFLARGSTKEADALIASLTPEQARDREVITWENDWYFHYKGDAAAYLALRDKEGTDLNFGDDDSALQYAEALIAVGQRDRANSMVRPVLERLEAASAKAPDDYAIWSSLAYAQAILGQHDAAMATTARVLAMLKPTDTPQKQFFINLNSGIVYGWAGEKDKAVDILLPYLGKPVSRYLNINGMRNDIDYVPMRGFPGWEAIVSDPKNNAPLSY